MDRQKEYKIEFADDDTQSVRFLFWLRIPSLIIGLVMGIFLSFATSRFEEVLSQNVSLAFFIPFIVYLADAVGTQTQNIYARDLKSNKAEFKNYLIKEGVLGIIFGLIFGLAAAAFVMLWHQSFELALAVSLSLFLACASAPIIAMLVTQFLKLEHTDPAAGAGPLATVIQDTISVLIYGFISSAILLS